MRTLKINDILDAKIKLDLETGLLQNLYFDFPDGIDTGYTFEIKKGDDTITKKVGNGITIVENRVLITLNEDDLTAGTYIGYCTSDSRVAGIYFNCEFLIEAIDTQRAE